MALLLEARLALALSAAGLSNASAARLIAVTGAAGFIGSALVRRARINGQSVRRFVRDPAHADAGDAVAIDLAQGDRDELARRLDGVYAVVHLAGRAHAMDERAPNADALHEAANVVATERLARAALAAGVRRFVFASTIKVNGETTPPGRPFKPDDAPAPSDAYARSKLAAERVLAQAASGTPMTVVNLRLPLVYGPGARGNFRRLVEAVAARRALPLGAIDNRRSLLSLDNLLDAIDAALYAELPSAGTHLLADADSVSTPALVRAIASALGVAPRLFRVPVPLLRLAGTITGRAAAVARLTGSLEADSASFRNAAGWRPRPFAIDGATLGRGA